MRYIIIVDKWRRHRRIITPVFNANLLEQFFPVFNEKNQILIRNLQKEVNKPQAFDLWDYIANTALDIICREFFLLLKIRLNPTKIFFFFSFIYIKKLQWDTILIRNQNILILLML